MRSKQQLDVVFRELESARAKVIAQLRKEPIPTGFGCLWVLDTCSTRRQVELYNKNLAFTMEACKWWFGIMTEAGYSFEDCRKTLYEASSHRKNYDRRLVEGSYYETDS